MNERIKQLAVQAGAETWSRAPGWVTGLAFTDKNLEKFAELIVKECIDNIEVWEKDSRNHISYMLKQHFESGNPIEGSEGLHPCPYREEIHGDYESLCDCNEEQQHQCRMDI